MVILSFLGIPFTPAAGAWIGLVNAPFTLYSVVYFVVHIVLVIGMFRHLFSAKDGYAHMERWIQFVYPLGLLLLIISHWVIATWGWPGSYTAGVWWASIVPIMVLGSGYYLVTQTNFWEDRKVLLINWFENYQSHIGTTLTGVLRLRWLSNMASWLYNLFGRFAGIITTLLEGDGGILWVLLLLTLLIAVMTSRVVS